MTLQVMQSEAQNRRAREELRRRRISYWPGRPRRSLLDLALRRSAIDVGDPRKSWDVLESVRLIESRLPPDAPILDLGAYASEILCCLHLAGFRRLTGIDLNPRVRAMPFNRSICYRVGDMCATGLADGSQAAITAISAIEHGVDLPRLLAEAARLLAPGGLLVCSTDYWPQKIDTTGVRIYGLAWRIFSRAELQALIEGAAAHGLSPVSECRFEASESPIEHAGRRYTFAWLALAKTGTRRT